MPAGLRSVDVEEAEVSTPVSRGRDTQRGRGAGRDRPGFLPGRTGLWEQGRRGGG